MRQTVYFIMGLMFLLLLLMSFNLTNDPPDKQSVPNEYKTMKNPLKATTGHLENGKQLYLKNCAACHGEDGKGDGERVKYLVDKTILPANFHLRGFVEESDGTHFYKIKFGRNNQHSFKGKLNDEQIWEIVHYIVFLRN